MYSGSQLTPARWDPTTYAAFADHRSRPFFDLLGRVLADDPDEVVDLGCGSGELTTTLAGRWPRARVLGVDNSPDMLQRAAQHGNERLSFAPADLVTYLPPPTAQVVVSNAAYQWIPDHAPLLGQIAERLPKDGWLAVQVPGNFDSPSHSTIRSLVAEPRWQDATGGLRLRTDPVLTPAQYTALLAGAGLVPDVWESTYRQVLFGEDPVLDWVRGTALRPVLTALPEPLHRDFLAELGSRLRIAYPAQDLGAGACTVFAFRRIFMVGHRVA